MAIDLIDNKIQNAFSKSAVQYDVLAKLHREIGRELIKKISPIFPCTAVLDVGMGTGWFTEKLSHIFSEGAVIGLDFSSGMIDAARKVKGSFQIVQAKAQALPFKDETFDIITSNLAYQWMDLGTTFADCHRALKKDGTLSVTMFARETLNELFIALEQCIKNKDAFTIHRLASEEDIRSAIVTAGFHEIHITSERIKVRFPDFLSLVKWIKDIGANALERDFYVGRDLLTRTAEYYENNYKDRLGIFATFEVVWLTAQK